jgi:hypothetical protein
MVWRHGGMPPWRMSSESSKTTAPTHSKQGQVIVLQLEHLMAMLLELQVEQL